MTVLGQPDPLQPTDTQDKITRLETRTLGPFAELDHVEFECAKCHQTYWREVLHEMQYSEVIEVEGVEVNGRPAQYALNPTIHDYYAPNVHSCTRSVKKS
jgi:hypothetical protein